jgi:hypothetical protein
MDTMGFAEGYYTRALELPVPRWSAQVVDYINRRVGIVVCMSFA